MSGSIKACVYQMHFFNVPTAFVLFIYFFIQILSSVRKHPSHYFSLPHSKLFNFCNTTKLVDSLSPTSQNEEGAGLLTLLTMSEEKLIGHSNAVILYSLTLKAYPRINAIYFYHFSVVTPRNKYKPTIVFVYFSRLPHSSCPMSFVPSCAILI